MTKQIPETIETEGYVLTFKKQPKAVAVSVAVENGDSTKFITGLMGQSEVCLAAAESVMANVAINLLEQGLKTDEVIVVMGKICGIALGRAKTESYEDVKFAEPAEGLN